MCITFHMYIVAMIIYVISPMVLSEKCDFIKIIGGECIGIVCLFMINNRNETR